MHDFLLRSKKLHFEIEFMSLEMCHLLLTLKKLLENELRFVTDVVDLRIFCHAGSVMRIAFKYELTGFRINFFQNDFSVYYFVFVYS